MRCSPKQLKDRMTKWNLKKYAQRHDMIAIARTQLQRKRDEQKESAFYLNDKPVAERKISRFLKRNKISEDALLSIKDPVEGEKPLAVNSEDL